MNLTFGTTAISAPQLPHFIKDNLALTVFFLSVKLVGNFSTSQSVRVAAPRYKGLFSRQNISEVNFLPLRKGDILKSRVFLIEIVEFRL
jgi:hypothetical protein